MDKTAIISLKQVTRFKLTFDPFFPDQATLLLDAPSIGGSSYDQDAGSMMMVKQYEQGDYPYQHTSTNTMITRRAAREILELQGIVFKDPISQDLEYAKP